MTNLADSLPRRFLASRDNIIGTRKYQSAHIVTCYSCEPNYDVFWGIVLFKRKLQLDFELLQFFLTPTVDKYQNEIIFYKPVP